MGLLKNLSEEDTKKMESNKTSPEIDLQKYEILFDQIKVSNEKQKEDNTSDEDKQMN